jgi:cbb3-type cytochrome oxidase subunit 3
MVTLDATTLALLGIVGTWALVVGTLVLMYWQTRKSQRLNSANAIMALRERFDSSYMRKHRKALATALLQHTYEDIVNIEVGAFFELVGSLTHRDVLDEDLVWEAFGTWITAYFQAMRQPVDVLDRARRDLEDPLLLHDFEWLNQRMRELDQRMLGHRHTTLLLSDNEVRGVLQRDRNLETS